MLGSFAAERRVGTVTDLSCTAKGHTWQRVKQLFLSEILGEILGRKRPWEWVGCSSWQGCVTVCPDFRLHGAPRHSRALRAAASVPAGRRREPKRLHQAVWYIPLSAGHNCPPFSYQVSSCNFLATYLFIPFGVLHFLFVPNSVPEDRLVQCGNDVFSYFLS